ncbi:hypothetical protein [Sphingomonas sp. CFBP 8760]|uniref:hypothetical protein n=1 Tax=Sphingomonas sp. CFBP 8760 TaxID=2775282 RepID=UPI0017806470|nr:hypothetical protein [Sphingomonas sp. CFBP 8760]MBD8545301.1 hypothetical protein [Sphingomonas sp. CFBP 8760]
MTPNPTISIDTTNDTASIALKIPDGAYVHINQIELGDTGSLTMDQVDAKARALAREALKAAIDAL